MSNEKEPTRLSEAGKAAYQKADFQMAAQLFMEAMQAFKQNGDELSAAEMANNRSVALLQGGDPAGSLKAVEGSDLVFAKAGDVRRQAMALGNQGAALEALGLRNEALATYQKASNLFKDIGEHELRAPLLRSISSLQLRTGGALSSIVTMRNSLQEIEHPNGFQRFVLKIFGFLLGRFGL